MSLTYEDLYQHVQALGSYNRQLELILRSLIRETAVGAADYDALFNALQATSSQFGDVSGGDYSSFAATGLLTNYGAAQTWRDIDFKVVIRNAAVNRPVVTTLFGNLTAPQWAVGDYYGGEGEELIHQWVEGSEVSWHLHMYAKGDATDSYVNWEVEYTWANVSLSGEAVPATATVTSGDFLIPADATAALKFFVVPISAWTPTDGKIAAHVKPRLKRVAATGAAPSVDPWCEMLQLHIQTDTQGSSQLFTK